MKYIPLILIVFSLSSCADFKETNQMISDSNTAIMTAFGQAMTAAAQTESNADDVAIAMAFASRMGQQDFIKPETARDWFNSGLHLVDSVGRWWQILGSTDDSSMSAGRDIYVNSSRSSNSGFDLFNQGNGTANYSTNEVEIAE